MRTIPPQNSITDWLTHGRN